MSEMKKQNMKKQNGDERLFGYTWREWCKQNGVRLTPTQVVEMTYLEAMGKRFMVDFGYENSREKVLRCLMEKDMEYIEVPGEILAEILNGLDGNGGVM